MPCFSTTSFYSTLLHLVGSIIAQSLGTTNERNEYLLAPRHLDDFLFVACCASTISCFQNAKMLGVSFVYYFSFGRTPFFDEHNKLSLVAGQKKNVV